MNILVPHLTVFGLGMIGMWIAIPIGIAIQLQPSVIVILTALGASTGSLLVVSLGSGIRKRLSGPCRRLDPYDESSLTNRIWHRYGIIGLGFIAPLVTGIPLGTAIALALGGNKLKVSVCMVSGIILWSVILTLAAVLGAAALGIG
jgi:membrane protein YqaA with SNARE-associated domain